MGELKEERHWNNTGVLLESTTTTILGCYIAVYYVKLKNIIPADKTSKWLDLQRRAHDDEKIAARKVLMTTVQNVHFCRRVFLPTCSQTVLTIFIEVKNRTGRFSPKKTMSG